MSNINELADANLQKPMAANVDQVWQRPARTPPGRIWLQYHGDSDEPLLDGEEVSDVTWCQDKINARDVEYVRADWMARLEKIEEAAKALVKCKGRYHSEQNMKALIEAVNLPHF